MSRNPPTPDRLAGVLLGTAVGDALGLPAEGLRPATIARLGWMNHPRHRFLGRRGMWSDDTEHTIMVAQAFLASDGDPDRFVRAFASALRWWLAGLPGGTGLATARAILRLWIGISPRRTGVFSAGNGPCMRAAVIGAVLLAEPASRHEFTRLHTEITHSDPKALVASRAVADLAALLCRSSSAPSRVDVLRTLQQAEADDEWRHLLGALERAASSDNPAPEILERLGADPRRGISGYCYQTVAAVVFCGLHFEWSYRETVSHLVAAGGDTDTAAAIGGALCGALHGTGSIPMDWLRGVREWPTRTSDLERLAHALATRCPLRIRRRWSPALLARNAFFLAVVLAHGVLRLLPSGLRKASS